MYSLGYCDALDALGLSVVKTASGSAIVKYVPKALATVKKPMSRAKQLALMAGGAGAVGAAGGAGYMATRKNEEEKTASGSAMVRRMPTALATVKKPMSRKKLMALLAGGAGAVGAAGGAGYMATRKNEEEKTAAPINAAQLREILLGAGRSTGAAAKKYVGNPAMQAGNAVKGQVGKLDKAIIEQALLNPYRTLGVTAAGAGALGLGAGIPAGYAMGSSEE